MRITSRFFAPGRFQVPPLSIIGGGKHQDGRVPAAATGSQHDEADGDDGFLRLVRRESMRDQNIMIGVIVGVVLLLFLAALIYFLHRYHGTIRFSRRRRPRRYGNHHDHYSSSSKGSHTSSDVGPPPPPPV